MPGLLQTVRAQPTAVETIRRALAADRVHHAYLFAGPDGVGKERLAFGLAQALVCERRTPEVRPEGGRLPEGLMTIEAEACGQCSACRRALPSAEERRPLHPDVVVLERGLYDPAALGRRSPETQELSIDQVRTLVLARASFPPHEGRAKVFIVRRAEEASTAAANALLKTLEEPGARTHFVLLSSVPDALLPTIRSRAQWVRFGALPDATVAELLAAQGVAAEQAVEVARLSGGSMAVASALADPDASAARQELVARTFAALESRDTGAVYDLAAEAKPRPKETITVQLEALAAALGAEARAAVGRADRSALVAAVRHGLALAAVRQLEGNASAQLAIETMLLRMRGV